MDLGKDDPGSTFSAILLGYGCKYNGQCGYGGKCANNYYESDCRKSNREKKIPGQKSCCCKKGNPGRTCLISCGIPIWGGK